MGCNLVLLTNRKSHTGFRLVSTSMTLNDLERRWASCLRPTSFWCKTRATKRPNSNTMRPRTPRLTSSYSQGAIHIHVYLTLPSCRFSWNAQENGSQNELTITRLTASRWTEKLATIDFHWCVSASFLWHWVQNRLV